MKIKTLVYIIAGLVLLLALSFARGCKLTDKLSILEGQHQELQRAADALDKAHLKLEIGSERIIAEKNAEIKRLLDGAGQPTPAEIDKDKTIAAQKKEIARLKAQGDYKAALEVAEAALREQASKFTLAEERHKADIFSLNAAWEAKFDAQVKLTDSWKQRFEAEARLHQLSRQELGIMAGQLRWAKIKGTLGTGLFIAGAAFAGYSALKGSK